MSIQPVRPSQTKIEQTMHAAWWCYFGFLLLPLLLLAYVLPTVLDRTSASFSTTIHCLIGALVFTVVTSASALFLRSRLFAPYARGELVTPRTYLRGMVTVWALIEAGILGSFVACFLASSLFPILGAALIACFVLAAVFPGGDVMVGHEPQSDNDDPAVQHELH